jgi:hypothetical protein
MKKHKQHKQKRRNASSGVPTPPRPRGAGSRGKANNGLKAVGIAMAGGALGALAAGIAVGAGVKPQTAAIATLAGGAVGAYALRGNAKAAAIGAACAASGQLALAWQVKRQAEAAIKADEKRKESLVAQNAPAQPPALPAAPPAGPKRNGYEDEDGSDDLRNAGEIDDYSVIELVDAA